MSRSISNPNRRYQREWARQDYKKFPEKWKQYRLRTKVWRKQYNLERYNKTRELINRAKMHPCTDCGKQYNPWVMDFDHRNPAEKLFAVSTPGRASLITIQKEIDKCDLVCSNCHRERTHKQQL